MNPSLHLTPLGHACVLVELDTPTRHVRLLLDPGNLAPALDPIEDLDAILITHPHPDHLDVGQIRRVAAGRHVPLYGDAETAGIASEAGIADVHLLVDGRQSIAGVPVDVSVAAHEVIYPGMPRPTNLALRIADRVFTPGDSFLVPSFPVEVLLAPTGAPWMKLAEAVDYVRSVAPAYVVPIHDGGLAAPHRAMHRGLMTKYAPEGTAVLPLEPGQRQGFPTD